MPSLVTPGLTTAPPPTHRTPLAGRGVTAGHPHGHAPVVDATIPGSPRFGVERIDPPAP